MAYWPHSQARRRTARSNRRSVTTDGWARAGSGCFRTDSRKYVGAFACIVTTCRHAATQGAKHRSSRFTQIESDGLARRALWIAGVEAQNRNGIAAAGEYEAGTAALEAASWISRGADAGCWWHRHHECFVGSSRRAYA